MKKRILLICFIILCLTGCNQKKENEKLYLTEKYYENKENSFQEITEKEITKLKKDTYILYTFNSFCKFSIPCDSIFEQFMEDNNITIVSIPYDNYKKTEFVKEVKYAPSVLIINKNKVIAYLDADAYEDIEKYQDIKEFTNWVKKYIYLKNK